MFDLVCKGSPLLPDHVTFLANFYPDGMELKRQEVHTIEAQLKLDNNMTSPSDWRYIKGTLYICPYSLLSHLDDYISSQQVKDTWSQPPVRGTTPHHSQCVCTGELQGLGPLGAAPQPAG